MKQRRRATPPAGGTYAGLEQLGHVSAIPASPEAAVLERVPNPHPRKVYLARFTAPEFTSLCPMTGHPDFADITVRYVADKKCVELKSLKLYFHAYRNEGIFFEAATNKICDDLGAALQARSLEIVADWKARGGFTSKVIARWEPKAAAKRAKKR